ncbi:MAG: FtsX-like permease family protein, partial [Bacteroidetes bacterium]
MLIHYLRILLRKQPVFTAINLAGLAIGMTACLMIWTYIRYEWSYDRQSPYASDIWRVYNQTMDGETVLTEDANSHSAAGPVLKADVADVVDFARLYNEGKSETVVVTDGKPYEIGRFYCTDPGFLRMFPQKFLYGSATGCLDQPGTAVITESHARRIYGTADALGKTFRINGGMCAGTYTITGVVADPPQNTHLRFGLLTSFSSRIANGHEDNFESYWEYTYLQLRPGAGPENVRRRLNEINAQFLKQEGIRLDVQRFEDIHLHSRLTYEIEPNGSARAVQFLGLVALLILGIALINYINLSTALAAERAREVGIRKSLGASRGTLVRQFFVENSLISLAALGLSVLLLRVLLPVFARMTGFPLPEMASGWRFWLQLAAFWGVVTLLAGAYPSLLLSGFAPALALRGRFMASGAQLRRLLVIFQFAFSSALIFGVMVVSKQVHFLKNHDLGLHLDQLVAIQAQAAESSSDSLAKGRLALLHHAYSQISSLKGVAASSIAPGLGINTISGSNRPIHWVKSPSFARATSYFVETDTSFFDLYGIKILAGKPVFFPDRERRHSHVAINRAMLEVLGFPDAESAIGEHIAYENSENAFQMTITAVLENLHIESLKVPPKPTLYYCYPAEQLSYLTVKMSPGNVQSTLEQMQRAWAGIYPELPFRYWFLDDHFAAQYQSETQFGQIFALFAGLAICISCLGLFGLVAYHTGRRRKEIGIRKILGASVARLTGLMARDFLKPVAIAVLLASPIAWY